MKNQSRLHGGTLTALSWSSDEAKFAALAYDALCSSRPTPPCPLSCRRPSGPTAPPNGDAISDTSPTGNWTAQAGQRQEMAKAFRLAFLSIPVKTKHGSPPLQPGSPRPYPELPRPTRIPTRWLRRIPPSAKTPPRTARVWLRGGAAAPPCAGARALQAPFARRSHDGALLILRLPALRALPHGSRRGRNSAKYISLQPHRLVTIEESARRHQPTSPNE